MRREYGVRQMCAKPCRERVGFRWFEIERVEAVNRWLVWDIAQDVDRSMDSDNRLCRPLTPVTRVRIPYRPPMF